MKDMRKVVIIGAGGHGKVVADVIQKSGDKVIGFLDDDTSMGNSFIGFPVFGTVADYEKYRYCEFVIAIGNAVIREQIADRLAGVKWHTAIHPTAVISDIGVSIGEGTVVMANAVVNPVSMAGRHCIINTGAVIEHDSRLGDFVHVSVGAKLAGAVNVGKGTWIGIGASVNNNLNICGSCMIGTGAVVIKDISEPGTYLGVPAERLEK